MKKVMSYIQFFSDIKGSLIRIGTNTARAKYGAWQLNRLAKKQEQEKKNDRMSNEN